ncbi:MAG TPA: TIR domain-containing protein [Ramlibacter sp.]|jgi:hypothetical protein
MANRSHVFISHHHADDAQVSRLTGMLARAGHEIRNSSIRAKPANQQRLDRGLVSDRTIKRLLRMKMSWASTVVVLIGKNTHKRPWVDWEINTAKEKGKRIVGVFERGGTENDIPEPLKKYHDSLVAWNSDEIIGAIQGDFDRFENPDGGERGPVGTPPRSNC